MAAKKSEVVTIAKPSFRSQTYRIRGTSPLHCNKMSEETRQGLINKQCGDKEIGATPPNKEDTTQLEDSTYRLPENSPWRAYGYEYGFPGRGLKKALVEAARPTSRDMVEIKSLLRVTADMVPIVKGEPRFHAEIINKPMGGCSVSVRAVYDEWEMLVPVKFLEGAKGLTPDEVGSLFALAGETVGLGCGRTIKCGTNGAFEVVSDPEAK